MYLSIQLIAHNYITEMLPFVTRDFDISTTLPHDKDHICTVSRLNFNDLNKRKKEYKNIVQNVHVYIYIYIYIYIYMVNRGILYFLTLFFYLYH